MSNTTISLKPVNDLLGMNFFIPAYQRGYRWTEQQVSELLDDVKTFQSNPEGSFYCLQPIVLKELREDGAWEVVDGQQRLTTLFLILQYFNERLAERFRRNIYSIDFKSRPGSKEYLGDLSEERSTEYVDFHYLFQAKHTIESWFSDKDHLVNDIEAALLNRVKVIWYQLPQHDNPIDAFTRLNIGKIPLTNAELIRALFLRSKNFPDVSANLMQLKIAQEWDSIEKALQNDDFWYFLTDDANRPNRIELVFDLITDARSEKSRTSFDTYGSFHHFNELISRQDTSPEQLWDEIKQYFMTLQEWFHSHELFHYVGYLVNEGDRVLDLIRLSRESGKNAFRHALKGRILKRLIRTGDVAFSSREELVEILTEHIESLEYGSHSPRIKSLLLLFNIASVVANKKSIVRFRFDYFKKESWDIEHIRSVESGRPNANVDKRPWLETVRDYFKSTGESHDLSREAEEMLESRSYTTGDAFDLFYDRIIKYFEEEESTEAEDGIGNLALLDSGSNRGYKNAVFPIKRRKLLQYDQEGTFVPLCTRNAFLKCYSQNLEHMFSWRADDQADYRTAIIDTLADFFVD